MVHEPPGNRPQVAFLDHAYAVVDARTADEIAGCEFLQGFGRLEVKTTVSEGETWTGRYLLGRGTYVELFGPDDLEGPDEGEGSTGIGLSTCDRGGLGLLADRLKDGETPVRVERRTRHEGEEDVPWFDSVSLSESPQTFDLWVMQYLDDLTDLQRRESAFLEWARRSEAAEPQAQRSCARDVTLVELGATGDDIAMAEPLLHAAGFAVTRSARSLLARDDETTIMLHSTQRDAVGLRRLEFVLTAPAVSAQVEDIGRSRLTVGPGSRAVWDFMPMRKAQSRLTKASTS